MDRIASQNLDPIYAFMHVQVMWTNNEKKMTPCTYAYMVAVAMFCNFLWQFHGI